MNVRATSNAVSTSAASSAGGCESSSSGVCDIETRASGIGISGGEGKGGGQGSGDRGGVLGHGGGRDVPVGPDDDEADRVGVEPGLQPAGGIADHRDVQAFSRVAGRCGV